MELQETTTAASQEEQITLTMADADDLTTSEIQPSEEIDSTTIVIPEEVSSTESSDTTANPTRLYDLLANSSQLLTNESESTMFSTSFVTSEVSSTRTTELLISNSTGKNS